MTAAPKRKSGKPSEFSQEIADQICVRLMGEESLRAICRDPDMPARSTVHVWLNQHKAFRAQYDDAWKIKRENWADDVVDIADTPLVGTRTVVRGDKIETVTADNVERSKLMADTRKWMLARMDPQRFGDKARHEHSGPDGKPIEYANVSLTDDERAQRVNQLLDTARTRRAGQDPDAAEDVGTATRPTDDRV